MSNTVRNVVFIENNGAKPTSIFQFLLQFRSFRGDAFNEQPFYFFSLLSVNLDASTDGLQKNFKMEKNTKNPVASFVKRKKINQCQN